jgi:hypothetical protein
VKCRNCGTELPTGAMFCGECGATVTVPRLVEPATRARPGDTVTIQPVLPPVRNTPSTPKPPPVPPIWGRPHAEPVVEHVAGPEPEPERVPEPRLPEAELPETQLPEPQLPSAPLPAPARIEPVAPARIAPVVPGAAAAAARPPLAERPAPPSVPLSMPSSAPSVAGAARTLEPSLDDDHHDVEATRIVSGRQRGDRFVLQFSTGENSIVFGTGLVGRNPVLEPGEFVDQLIAIVDPGKSVSKTHLEFGQDEGRFWVSDRFSANGTIVRQPDSTPQRLEPGRRQQVVRGTRIDIGEQFFVVS